jgi:DNA invertase Pin-like site-specific DNA recombinase
MITDREPRALQSDSGIEGIDTASLQQIVDIDSASLRKIVTAIAAAQKTLRSERSVTGLAAAKRRGQKLGRPPLMAEAQTALARRLLANGVTRRVIAKTLKVSRSTLYIALRPYAATLPPNKPICPLGRPNAMTEAQIAHARRLLANGVPRKIIASTLKVSRTTLSIALKPYSMGPHSQMVRRKQAPSSEGDSAPPPEPARAETPKSAEKPDDAEPRE